MSASAEVVLVQDSVFYMSYQHLSIPENNVGMLP